MIVQYGKGYRLAVYVRMKSAILCLGFTNGRPRSKRTVYLEIITIDNIARQALGSLDARSAGHVIRRVLVVLARDGYGDRLSEPCFGGKRGSMCRPGICLVQGPLIGYIPFLYM